MPDQAPVEICMFAWTDLPALVELANAAADADQEDEHYTRETLRDELEAHNDPETDCFVAMLPNARIVGYAYVEQRSDADRVWGFGWGCVHPEFRHQGIGRRLACAADAEFTSQARSSNGKAVFIQRDIRSSVTGHIELAKALGYRELRSSYRMTITLDRPFDPVPMPDGFELRPFVPRRDAHAVYEADQAAFMDGGGKTVPLSFEHWYESYVEKDFYPNLWLAAWAGDTVAGYCITHPWGPDQPDLAWLTHLGVRPDWRGCGLGNALLRHSFYVDQRAGFKRMALSVRADSPTAVNLYLRTGMSIYSQYIQFRKVLRGDPAQIKS